MTSTAVSCVKVNTTTNAWINHAGVTSFSCQKKDCLNFTHVTVENLSSLISYTVKIYARNRVRDLAERKHGIEGNHAEITVRTNRPWACFSKFPVT